MALYFIAVLLFITATLGWMYKGIGVSVRRENARPARSAPHFYQNQDRSIEEIRIAAFYFVPKDKKGEIASDWRARLDRALTRLGAFHKTQFQARSRVRFLVYPEPFDGLGDTRSYEATSTDRGNPVALIRAGEELDRRVLRPGGDRYRPDMASHLKKGYPVMALMYEGVGASGGIIAESRSQSVEKIATELGVPESLVYLVNIESVDGFFMLGRDYFTQAQEEPFAATLLAHEFYHTVGIPDSYEYVPALSHLERASTTDLMGAGRYVPLERAHLDRETLDDLGR